MTTQFNARLPKNTIKRINDLSNLYGSQAKVIIAAVEHLHTKETNMSELFDIVGIKPSDAGFGEYQVFGAHTSDPVDLYEWRTSIQADGYGVYELGKDELPEGVEDIRGIIHDRPDVVFAVETINGDIDYWGANLL